MKRLIALETLALTILFAVTTLASATPPGSQA